MSDEHRFPVEKMDRLDSPDRVRRQPVAPLVALVEEAAPAVVLDVGAGTGYFALPIAEALPRTRVIGLDVEPRMLAVIAERAAERGLTERVQTLEAPSDRLPLADGAADLALMVALYHELGDRPAYLAEVRRVLRDDGVFVVSDWRPEGTHESGPPAECRVPRATVEAELSAAGFGPVEVHDLYSDFYVVVGRLGRE